MNNNNSKNYDGDNYNDAKEANRVEGGEMVHSSKRRQVFLFECTDDVAELTNQKSMSVMPLSNTKEAVIKEEQCYENEESRFHLKKRRARRSLVDNDVHHYYYDAFLQCKAALCRLPNIREEEAVTALKEVGPPYGLQTVMAWIQRNREKATTVASPLGRFKPTKGMPVRKLFHGEIYHGKISVEEPSRYDGQRYWEVTFDLGSGQYAIDDMTEDELLKYRADRNPRPPVCGRPLEALELFSGPSMVSQEFCERRWNVSFVDASGDIHLENLDLEATPDFIWVKFENKQLSGQFNNINNFLRSVKKANPHLIVVIENPGNQSQNSECMEDFTPKFGLHFTTVTLSDEYSSKIDYYSNDSGLLANLSEHNTREQVIEETAAFVNGKFFRDRIRYTPKISIEKNSQNDHKDSKKRNKSIWDKKMEWFRPKKGMIVQTMAEGKHYFGKITSDEPDICVYSESGQEERMWEVTFQDDIVDDVAWEDLLRFTAKMVPCRGRQFCCLELFSGRGIVSQEFWERKWNVCSLDIDPTSNATIKEDILKFKLESLPFVPDFIWASPPCITYSRLTANIHRSSTNLERSPEAKEANFVFNEMSMILYQVKKVYPHMIIVIENPDAKLKEMPLMKELVKNLDLHMTTVDYCAFGRDDKKPTNIWSNDWYLISHLSQFTCRNKCQFYKKIHPMSVRGYGSRYNFAEIPQPLASQVADYVDTKFNADRIQYRPASSPNLMKEDYGDM